MTELEIIRAALQRNRIVFTETSTEGGVNLTVKDCGETDFGDRIRCSFTFVDGQLKGLEASDDAYETRQRHDQLFSEALAQGLKGQTMTKQEAYEIIIRAARNYAEFISGDEDELSQRDAEEVFSAIELLERAKHERIGQ